MRHIMISLISLRSAMREKLATRRDLAKVAGVCDQTVHKAMNREPIRLGMALIILQALDERSFTRKRMRFYEQN